MPRNINMIQGTHTHWRMTINNYDETDLALVQQGYPDLIRQIVYTLEKGEEGTPHIQAFIKMKRDVRMSHMKKLFPRGNFGAMNSSEWILNQQRYAQKLDDTAQSPAIITNWDPLHTLEGVMRKVINQMIEEYGDDCETDLQHARKWVERGMVKDDYKYAKVFVSATYKSMWKEFGHQMYECIFMEKERERQRENEEIRAHTHTHTHADEIISARIPITTDGEGTEQEEYEDAGEESGQDDQSDQDSEGSYDETDSESGSVSDCSSSSGSED